MQLRVTSISVTALCHVIVVIHNFLCLNYHDGATIFLFLFFFFTLSLICCIITRVTSINLKIVWINFIFTYVRLSVALVNNNNNTSISLVNYILLPKADVLLILKILI